MWFPLALTPPRITYTNLCTSLMVDSAFDYLESRILSCYAEAKQLRNGGMCRPRMAIIYPTYACNHRCIGCDYAEQDTGRGAQTLSKSQLETVVDQVIDFGIPAVEFCGGGEPLLHPQIEDAVERLCSRGVSVGILTNGTAISPLRAQLLTRLCSYVRVSVEAGCAETFQRVKRPLSASLDFEQVMQNLCLLLGSRREQASRCQISYKFTVDKNNFEDIEAAICLVAKLGVDSIQFKSIRNVPSELSIEEKSMLNRCLAELRAQYPAVRILGSLLPYRVSTSCWLSPLNVVIDPVGDLYLCCYYRHRRERHRFGNLFSSSLRELWYSDEHREKLRGIRDDECERYDCRFMRYAETLNKALEFGQLEFL
jgi:radical SAM protein with 4Fe4S-binding SPASM domain